ncbi:MAG: AAA family ATPase [Actinomycetota bacterium]
MSTNRETRLVVICGLPGAGKTTHGMTLADELGGVRFSPDEWMETLAISLWDEDSRGRIEALQWDLAKDLLRLGQTVIIEWGTWARAERDALRNEGRALGASVELHYLSEPIDVLWDRIRSRGAESPAIQREDLEAWVGAFEPPTQEEMGLYDEVYLRTS